MERTRSEKELKAAIAAFIESVSASATKNARLPQVVFEGASKKLDAQELSAKFRFSKESIM
ncbi:hypothetical protein [uncultured Marivita sp.]|uniref:hypothetical protein n=1 Tax=uncultured Marivita sp. TaxID=888080 RepID=UPI00261A7283|nr:hypothetical protein [uncultured Marivita sp.]